ncbi:MAG: hypothetical protein CR967_01215 [Proteobacteria bacterium]|nr:MAG: hypothetical protein CR967_01215 [Pseudomonadota bacterium]
MICNKLDNKKAALFEVSKSKNKICILIIDHRVPEHDKDAGSRTMYQYLIEFVNMGYQVIFVPINFEKLGKYGDNLEQQGIKILYGPKYHQNGFAQWLKNNARNINIFYLLRPNIANKYLELIREHNNKSTIIYNSVDFHYLRLEREYLLTNNCETKRNAAHYKKIEFEIFQKVDLVVTISDYERKVFEREIPNNQIKVIPTYIYSNQFPLSSNESFYDRKGILFVGGFSHRPNEDGLMWFICNEWEAIKRSIPDIVLNVVGSNVPKDIKRFSIDPQINILGYISDESLENLYNSCRVVIAPLRYGAGVKGKVIEAIAQGVPIVTTDIASEGIIDKDNVVKNVTIRNSFSNSLIELYTNEKLWKNFRLQQIKYANKYYSEKAAKDMIQNIFTTKWRK